jgi:MFS family permease
VPVLQAAPQLLRARTAVATAFVVNGLVFASVIARTPALRDTLGLSAAGLGLLLLCISVGAVAGLPLAGPVVQRLGASRAVFGASLSVGLGLGGVGVGLLTTSIPLVAPSFVLVGLGMGVWDVAMNVEGADVERGLDRALMPRLHAGFSIGTVAGAGVGALCAATGVPLGLQVLVVAALAPASMAWAVRRFLPERVAGPGGDQPRRARALTAWREPRTLAVGLMVLGFAFTEGSANDWMAVAMVDGYGTSETVGALGFAVFVTAMTVARFAGVALLARFGRVATLRGTAVVGLVGLLMVLLGGSVPVAMAGALLWGAGAALGFPVGMSAAADDESRAPVRVSVVSAIGYTAFLAGPPLIGLLAEHAGILRALFVVVAALTLGLVAAGAARPLPAPAPRTPA